MCGIAGFLDLGRSSPSIEAEEVVSRMAETLAHRGPDEHGTWSEAEAGIAFGHRRLSIVDLSSSGSQPMHSRDGRWVLNFNGEIYNHPALRSRLLESGVRLRGSSDTEVLLEWIAHRGVHQALDASNGMFAAAVWDRKERELWLVRDRVGEKPLYWGWFGQTLLFGSELKALRAHPSFRGSVDRSALVAYFRTGCVPSPYSIYTGVAKLPPGHLLRIQTGHSADTSRPQPYWSARDVAEEGLSSLHRGSTSEAIEGLDSALRDSVAIRMMADVPVGAFLSGGIDSSLVTALMQAQSSQPVRTFTIGFSDQGFDEAPFARRVADSLGTSHTELYVEPRQAIELIPRLPTIYDEPFADSSQIPTYLISALAREQVTVALSGDGGDELFAGYDRLLFHRRAGRYLDALPVGLRRGLAKRVSAVPSSTWLEIGQRLSRPTRGGSRRWLTGDRMDKLARVLEESGHESTYLSLASLWHDPAQVVQGGREAPTLLNRPSGWLGSHDPLNTFLWLDLVTYLPDDLLVKVDRAAMAVSLETRLPLLDPDVISLAWQLPVSMKVNDRQSKWILKEVLARYVPRELFDRPKKGFSVPVGAWLQGPLREWGEEVLDPSRLRQQGYLDERVVADLWNRHQQGVTDASHRLWTVLMFQAWLDLETATVPI